MPKDNGNPFRGDEENPAAEKEWDEDHNSDDAGDVTVYTYSDDDE